MRKKQDIELETGSEATNLKGNVNIFSCSIHNVAALYQYKTR